MTHFHRSSRFILFFATSILINIAVQLRFSHESIIKSCINRMKAERSKFEEMKFVLMSMYTLRNWGVSHIET